MPDKTYLEWPFFEARHKGLTEELNEWCRDKTKSLACGEVDEECSAWVRALAEGGWLKHATPDPTDPNARLDVRSLCLIRETLARHNGLADFAFAMQGLGAGPIALFGTKAQQDAYLPAVRSGAKTAAFALSEAEAGSDVASLSTTANREGDCYVLNGSKAWISNAGIADFYLLFARTGEAPGAKGLSAFIVNSDTPGLSVSERLEVLAPHPLGCLKLQDCYVPRTDLLGVPGEGFKIAMSTLDIFRPTVGAAALGFARLALDETVRHVSNRRVFGAPLAEMQITQGKIGDMAVRIDAAALLVYRAAWAKDLGAPRVTREAAMAKYYSTEAAQEVIDMAVQLHGARGVLSGSPVERLYREVRALRIYEGASEIQRLIIAKQLLSAFDGANQI